MRYTRSNHGVARGGFEIEVRRMHIHQDSFLYPFVTLEHLLPSIFDKNLRPTRNSFQTVTFKQHIGQIWCLFACSVLSTSTHPWEERDILLMSLFSHHDVFPRHQLRPAAIGANHDVQLVPVSPFLAIGFSEREDKRKLKTYLGANKKKWRRSSSGSHS